VLLNTALSSTCRLGHRSQTLSMQHVVHCSYTNAQPCMSKREAATDLEHCWCTPATSTLRAGLAPAQRLEWRLLYNSQKHGISFSTFLGRLGEATPTLLLIRWVEHAKRCPEGGCSMRWHSRHTSTLAYRPYKLVWL